MNEPETVFISGRQMVMLFVIVFAGGLATDELLRSAWPRVQAFWQWLNEEGEDEEDDNDE